MILDLLRKRFSVRSFKDIQIAEDILQDMLGSLQRSSRCNQASECLTFCRSPYTMDQSYEERRSFMLVLGDGSPV